MVHLDLIYYCKRIENSLNAPQKPIIIIIVVAAAAAAVVVVVVAVVVTVLLLSRSKTLECCPHYE